MALAQESDVIYSDRWLAIYSGGTLVIHKFYFPTASPRTLSLPRIKSVVTGVVLNLPRWKVKAWGVLPSRIYWALDWDRGILALQGRSDEVRKRCLVITTDKGCFNHIGVSCDNIEKSLSEVEKLGVEVLREPVKSHSRPERIATLLFR